MVRYLVAFGVVVVAGIVMEGRPGAAPEDNDPAVEEAAAADAVAEEALAEGEAADAETPTANPCPVCEGPACAPVQLQNPCMVKGAANLPPVQSAAQEPLSAAARHRARAVSPADFTPQAADRPAAPVGRAGAAPQNAPGKGAGPGVQLLDLFESTDLLLEDRPPSGVKTQFFRPLDLGDDADGDDEAEDKGEDN